MRLVSAPGTKVPILAAKCKLVFGRTLTSDRTEGRRFISSQQVRPYAQCETNASRLKPYRILNSNAPLQGFDPRSGAFARGRRESQRTLIMVNRHRTRSDVQFTGGKDTIIANGEIPAGYYRQMRLYTGVGSNVLLDRLTHPLEIPSGSRSGLKLNIQVTITGGVKHVLALDFDTSHSIVVTGNGRYMLKPVIKTVATAISGGLTGVVAPASTSPTVRAIAGTVIAGFQTYPAAT